MLSKCYPTSYRTFSPNRQVLMPNFIFVSIQIPPIHTGNVREIDISSQVVRSNEKKENTMLNKMKTLVKEKDICVLATVSGNKPYCSLMAYASNDEGTEIYMVSHKNTQKYRNLMENPNVSLLIDTRDEDKGPRRSKARALTVSGIFREIKEKESTDHIRAKLLERHPHMREFAHDPDAEVFSIKVTSFLLLEGLTDAYFEAVT